MVEAWPQLKMLMMNLKEIARTMKIPARTVAIIFVLFGLVVLSAPLLVRSITSDGSYVSPQSDGTYVSPQSDDDYRSPQSDQQYRSPQSDANYSSPTIGSGFEKPGTNQSNTSRTDSRKDAFVNTTKKNEGEKNTSENTTDTRTEKTRNLPRGHIDAASVGGWRPYSMTAYFADGRSKFLSPSNSVMNLHNDGTWNYGAEGTWEVTPVTEHDGVTWGIPIASFKNKILFHGWTDGSSGSAEGPIEDTSYGARFLWAVYDVEAGTIPELDAPAQVWVRFAKAPYTPKKEESFSELSLIGKWRSKDIDVGSSTQILELKQDKTWTFGRTDISEGALGTWTVMDIDEDDWKRWGLDPNGRKKKIVLVGWRDDIDEKNVADGPIEVDRGQVIYVSVYYGVISEILDGDLLKGGITFRPHAPTVSFLTTTVVGSGSVASQDTKIQCGMMCSGEYAADAEVTLSAQADQGWVFSGWTGACQRSDATCTISMDHSKMVSAEFVPGCTDDSACSAEESCVASQCVQVSCSCGVVEDRVCRPYACCSDAQCGDGKTCNQEMHSCVAASACTPVVINGDSADKHDLVFVGAGFQDASVFERAIRLLMDFEGVSQSKLGVFSLTPFKENNQKFNTWMVLAPDYPHYEEESPVQGIGVDTLAVPDDSYYQDIVKSCERDTVIIMSPGIFRSWAQFPTSGASGGLIFMSLNNPLKGPEFLGRTLAHEMGHAIGRLADEYVEYGSADRTETEEFPN